MSKLAKLSDTRRDGCGGMARASVNLPFSFFPPSKGNTIYHHIFNYSSLLSVKTKKPNTTNWRGKC